jgi:hypothetical protein
MEDTKAIVKVQCMEREIVLLYDAMPIVKAITENHTSTSNNNEQMLHECQPN